LRAHPPERSDAYRRSAVPEPDLHEHLSAHGCRVGPVRRRHDVGPRRLRPVLQHQQPAEPDCHGHQPAGDAARDHRAPHVPPPATPLPNPSCSTIELKSSDGNSWYRALIFEVRRRFSRGFSVQSSYTWSKTTDTTQASTFFSDATNGTTSAFPEFGTDYNKGPADWDTPHNWVFNVLWDVPFVKGHSGLAAALLGGWQLAGIGNVRSGQPLTVFV